MSSSFCPCLLCVGFLILAERVWICLFDAILQHLMTWFCTCLCSVLKDGVSGNVASCCLNKCLTLVSYCLFCKFSIQRSIQMFWVFFVKEFFLKRSWLIPVGFTSASSHSWLNISDYLLSSSCCPLTPHLIPPLLVSFSNHWWMKLPYALFSLSLSVFSTLFCQWLSRSSFFFFILTLFICVTYVSFCSFFTLSVSLLYYLSVCHLFPRVIYNLKSCFAFPQTLTQHLE